MADSPELPNQLEPIINLEVIEGIYQPQLNLALQMDERAVGYVRQAETRVADTSDLLPGDMIAHAQAKSRLFSAQRLAADQRRAVGRLRSAAVDALHYSDIPTTETYLAQSRFEGEDEDRAVHAVNALYNLNAHLANESNPGYIAVLGSYALSGADGLRHPKQQISFVKPKDTSPSLYLTRERRRHYLSNSPELVAQFSPYPPGGSGDATLDTSGKHRSLYEEPSAVSLLNDPNVAEDLAIHADLNHRLTKAILYGPAVKRAVSVLSANYAMRPLMFAALSAIGARDLALEVPSLPDVEPKQAAVKTFGEIIERFVLEQAHAFPESSGREHYPETATASSLWLAPSLQKYLGVTDAELDKLIFDSLSGLAFCDFNGGEVSTSIHLARFGENKQPLSDLAAQVCQQLKAKDFKVNTIKIIRNLQRRAVENRIKSENENLLPSPKRSKRLAKLKRTIDSYGSAAQGL
jgi:hypothetical protein